MPPDRHRIALNAQLLRLDAGYRSAGIARYIFQLLRALASADSEFDLHTFTHEPRAQGLLAALQLHLTRMPTQQPLTRIFWEQFVFPVALTRTRFDLVHALAFVSPFISTIPSIVTVYDLSFMLYPEYFRPMNRLYLKWGTRRSVARARRVIAISESTKRDVIRLFDVPSERIDVIPPGVEPEFFMNGDGNAVERFRREKNLPDHFILYLGTLEPRKNIPTLIRAFACAKTESHLPHQLVIAGGRGWKDQAIARAIEETGMQREIILPGFIPQAELRYWYRAADAFVYPSQYEGFGMPLLEALAAGTPVITSNISSLPEAVGGAGLLVNPRDKASLAASLARVLTDGARRDALIEQGRLHVRAFTWERAAQSTIQTYRSALH